MIDVTELFEEAVELAPDQVAYCKRLMWHLLSVPPDVARDIVDRRADNPLVAALSKAKHGHALYVYSGKRGGALQLEVIWDARGEVAAVPLFVPSSKDGTELELGGVSTSAPDYPLKQGDRLFVPLTEPRARAICTTLLEDAERASEAFAARLRSEYATFEEAVQSMTDARLQTSAPDIIHATSAHVNRPLPAPTAPTAPTAAELVVAERMAKLFIGLIGPYVKKRSGDDPAVETGAWASFRPTRYYGPDGADMPFETWFEKHVGGADDWTLFKDEYTARSPQGDLYLTKVLCYWVGLDFEMAGATRRIGAMLVSKLEVVNSELIKDWHYLWHGQTLEQAKAMSATLEAQSGKLTTDFEAYMRGERDGGGPKN